MLRWARVTFVSRLAAALIAVALSGVPRAVAMQAPIVVRHRCA
jgi:hypothetical protein